MKDRRLLTPREAAAYLRLHPRTVVRLAREGRIPATKVGNRWRFRMDALEAGGARVRRACGDVDSLAKPGGHDERFTLARLMRRELVFTDVAGTTREEVLREIVRLMEAAGSIAEPGKFLEMLAEREELMPTVIAPGVAIPHPRRAVPGMFAELRIVAAVSRTGADFGAEEGGVPVKVFFVICASDDRWHLRILSRLSRVLKYGSLAQRLMCAVNSDDVIRAVACEEEAVFVDGGTEAG